MWWWSVAIQLRKHAETATEPTAVIFFHSSTSSWWWCAAPGVVSMTGIAYWRNVVLRVCPVSMLVPDMARRPGAVSTRRAAASLNIAAASRLGTRKPGPG